MPFRLILVFKNPCLSQAVNSRPVTAKALFRSRAVLCGGNSGTATGSFSRQLRFSPVSIIPAMPHTLLHLRDTCTGRTNGRSLETFIQYNTVSEIGVHWVEKYFRLVVRRLRMFRLSRHSTSVRA